MPSEGIASSVFYLQHYPLFPLFVLSSHSHLELCIPFESRIFRVVNLWPHNLRRFEPRLYEFRIVVHISKEDTTSLTPLNLESHLFSLDFR